MISSFNINEDSMKSFYGRLVSSTDTLSPQ